VSGKLYYDELEKKRAVEVMGAVCRGLYKAANKGKKGKKKKLRRKDRRVKEKRGID
jgi:hypothetical protein